MKIFMFLTVALLTTVAASAQTGWTVELNNNVLLTAAGEDTVANQIILNDLKKGSLFVTLRGMPEKDVIRSMTVYDAGDNELYRKRDRSISIPVATLKQWAKKGTPVKVYTIATPINSSVAVRMRRVHLCTINFE